MSQFFSPDTLEVPGLETLNRPTILGNYCFDEKLDIYAQIIFCDFCQCVILFFIQAIVFIPQVIKFKNHYSSSKGHF